MRKILRSIAIQPSCSSSFFHRTFFFFFAIVSYQLILTSKLKFEAFIAWNIVFFVVVYKLKIFLGINSHKIRIRR